MGSGGMNEVPPLQGAGAGGTRRALGAGDAHVQAKGREYDWSVSKKMVLNYKFYVRDTLRYEYSILVFCRPPSKIISDTTV